MIEGGCSSSEPFALRVLGDSMAPEFAHGAIVVIDPSAVVRDGSFVIADQGGEVIFRQLRIVDGQYWLEALSEGYPRLEIEGLSAIRGVVVQRGGRRRSEHKHYV